MNPAVVIAAAAAISLLVIVLMFLLLRFRFERRFQGWQAYEREVMELEKEGLRRQAISQSRAVLGGRFTEQMAPYMPQFKYDPTEARFIGSPVDMLVFPGLSQGEPQEIVIMEIKNGPHAQLTSVERKIQRLVEDGMVRWELLHCLDSVPDQDIQSQD